MQIDQCQQFFGPRAAFGFADAAHFQTKGDIFPDRHQRKQRKVLEDQCRGALVGALARHILATNADDARGWIGKPRNHPQDCGFAAARWPQKRKELTGLNVDVYVVNSAECSEITADIIEINPGTHGYILPLGRSYIFVNISSTWRWRNAFCQIGDACLSRRQAQQEFQMLP